MVCFSSKLGRHNTYMPELPKMRKVLAEIHAYNIIIGFPEKFQDVGHFLFFLPEAACVCKICSVFVT